jgi:hypothetical protein
MVSCFLALVSIIQYKECWSGEVGGWTYGAPGVLAEEDGGVVGEGGARAEEDAALDDVGLEGDLPPGARAVGLEVHLAVECLGARERGGEVVEGHGRVVEAPRELGVPGAPVPGEGDAGDLGRGGSGRVSHGGRGRCEEEDVGEEAHCGGGGGLFGVVELGFGEGEDCVQRQGCELVWVWMWMLEVCIMTNTIFGGS